MKLKGPENCGGLTHGGCEYLLDDQGCIEVEDGEALAAAFAHGYTQAPADATSEQPPEQSVDVALEQSAPAESKARGKKA